MHQTYGITVAVWFVLGLFLSLSLPLSSVYFSEDMRAIHATAHAITIFSVVLCIDWCIGVHQPIELYGLTVHFILGFIKSALCSLAPSYLSAFSMFA